MKIISVIVLAVILGMGLFASAAGAQTDVKPDHWAYQAVKELANEGLILGYPDGTFMGNRAVTRYEMATIIKRVLDKIMEMKPAAGQGTPGPQGPQGEKGEKGEPGTPGVNPEELAQIQKLVDEFKTELTVIGTDMAGVKERLDAMENEISGLKDSIYDAEGPVQTVIGDVNSLKKTKISGYIQSRLQGADVKDEIKNTKSWTPFDFFVRRARVKISGSVTDRTAYAVQLDANDGKGAYGAAGNTTVGIKEANVTIANLISGADFTAGLQANQFGYEIPASSSKSLVPERGFFFDQIFTSNDYVKGAMLSGKQLGWNYYLQVINGVGPKLEENNNTKDIIAKIQRSFLNNTLDLGISRYTGTFLNTSNNTNYPRRAWDVDAEWVPINNLQILGEYIQGQHLGSNIRSYDAIVGYNITSKDVLVAAYNEYIPNTDTSGLKLSAIEGGLLHFIDDRTRLRFWIDQLTDKSTAGTDTKTTQYMFETQVVF